MPGRRSTPSKKVFLRDVKDHEMLVRLDQGLHRSLRFRSPSTIVHYFDINTWPGYLAITGDMGDFVFARLPNMFEFFRDNKSSGVRRTRRQLQINTGYWAEKLQAIDRRCGYEKWDAAKYKRQLWSYMFRYSWPKPVREQVEEDVFLYADEGQHSFIEAADTFFAEHNGKTYRFQDLWDWGDAMTYTYQYVWCCYAIVWAIAEYDAHKVNEKRELAKLWC